MILWNVLDFQLNDHLVLICENDRTIIAENSIEFLLNKWDKEGDLICEIPTWDSQDSEAVIIPFRLMERLESQARTRQILRGIY